MAALIPFRALRPQPADAAQIAAVPYDVVSASEATALANGNPLSFLRVSRAEIELCRGHLERELELLDPKLILLVGKMAIDAFLGKQPLTATVGSVFERDGRLFLPLPHASGVSRWLNDPDNRARLDQALTVLGRLRVELAI